MSENVIQPSFASGEFAPSMFARTDVQKYHSGAALLRNFFVDYRSGASTRPGTEFITQVANSGTKVRLIPFQYSTITSFVLEFGDRYIRFINNSDVILNSTAFLITGATQGNPVQITAPGNGFGVGTIIFIDGVVGMTQLNGRFFIVYTPGDTFTIATQTVVPIDGTNYSAFVGGGTVTAVYIISSPYLASELPLLKFTQSPTVMTLTHPNHVPYDLTIISPNNWTLAPTPFNATLSPPPLSSAVAIPPPGTNNYVYGVTSVDPQGRESLISTLAVVPNVGTTVQLQWLSVVGATSYNVYKSNASIGTPAVAGTGLGFIGTTASTTFNDSNISPNFNEGPPASSVLPAAPFQPACSTYFQQRKVYAATATQPQTLWASRTGDYGNFYISDPIQPDDAIDATIVSNQVNAIKSMLPMPGGLLMFASSGAWQLTGGGGFGAAQAVTAINATAIPQAYNGANDMPPIVLNYDVLFVQARGSIVRDLSYNLYAQIYTGVDVSVIANHLFFDFQLLEWGFAEEPFKIVWIIRDDGRLLSLTFVKEQEIAGWSHHDTLGRFESVCTVGEGLVNATYVVVRRNINGAFVRYIERFAERTDFTYGPEDAWCVDAGVQSGLNFPNADLYPSVGSGSGALMTSVPAAFGAQMVGWVVRAGGGIATVTQVLDGSHILVDFSRPMASIGVFPFSFGQWSITQPHTVFGGLDYLEGQTVSILADGGVVNRQVVTNGTVTLQVPATKVTVGLGYQCQLQTLPLDVAGGETIQGKRKKIAALTVRLVNSRGLKAGSTFNTLVPIKETTRATLMGTPIPLMTGDERVIMDPSWNVPGQICLQVDDPVPATVLGVIPEIVVGDTNVQAKGPPK
jgi:hypothetical protein